MEINLKKLSEQTIESTTTTRKMRLSEHAQSMVFQLFTKNVYSNPIGTVVREITSNCFDSHVEAKVNAPVRIKKSVDGESGTHYISFIDYGVGMSPDRVENVYGVYFESTKRVDNTQIGGFGIGGKTPLAYKRSTGAGEGEYDNSFYVITVFDKVKYYYCVYEGAESPEWSLMHQEATKERNGTEIRIPVLEKDIETFAKEMVRQLYYFENIIFEGFDDTYQRGILSNSYQIVRGKNFLFRGGEYSTNVHVCLGRVAYPLDFSILGLNSYDYRLPIALRLEVGDINVTVSRESLDYSEATIKMLKAKLDDAIAEIKGLLAKQYENIVTLEDYFKVKNEFGVLEFPNGMSIKIDSLISQKDIDFSNFKYQFMKMPNDRQLFKFFFEVKSYGKKPKRSRYSSSNYEFDGGYEELKRNNNILYVNDEFNRKVVKQAYLRSEYELYHIISKRNIANNFIRSEIAELFNVHLDSTVDENGKPVDYVISLQEMQDEYFEIVSREAKDYDKVEVPEDFIESRKREKITKEIRNSTLPIRMHGGWHRGNLERVKMDNLINFKGLIFFGTSDDEFALRNASRLADALFGDDIVRTSYSSYHGGFYSRKDSKKGILFLQLAQNNVKYMEFCRKAVHISKIKETLWFRKENTVKAYFQNHDIKEKWNRLGEMYQSELIGKVSPKWGAKVDEVKQYIDALPKVSGSLEDFKDKLSLIFDLTNVQSPAEKRIGKIIDELKTLETTNEPVLEYINMPYRIEYAKDELVEILKKVMHL